MRYPDWLKQFEPCEDAFAWSFPFDTLEAAWAKCNRPDWMLWLLERLGIPANDAAYAAAWAARAAASDAAWAAIDAASDAAWAAQADQLRGMFADEIADKSKEIESL